MCYQTSVCEAVPVKRQSVAGAQYPADWPAIAESTKQAAGWKCVRCGHRHDPESGYYLGGLKLFPSTVMGIRTWFTMTTLVLITGMTKTFAQRVAQSAAVSAWLRRKDFERASVRHEGIQAAIKLHMATATQKLNIVAFIVSSVAVDVMALSRALTAFLANIKRIEFLRTLT